MKKIDGCVKGGKRNCGGMFITSECNYSSVKQKIGV